MFCVWKIALEHGSQQKKNEKNKSRFIRFLGELWNERVEKSFY